MIRIGTTSFAAHNDMARRRLVVCVAALGTATAVQQARYGLPGPAPSALAEGRRLTDDSRRNRQLPKKHITPLRMMQIFSPMFGRARPTTAPRAPGSKGLYRSAGKKMPEEKET